MKDKVFEGLERCLSGKRPFGCGNCPYYGNKDYEDVWSCRLALMRDAYTMLKEQQIKQKVKQLAEQIGVDNLYAFAKEIRNENITNLET